MTAQWAAIVGGVIAALITGLVTVLVARLNNQGSRDNAMTAPYAELAADVVTLRQNQREDRRTMELLHDQLALVIDQRDDLLDYIRELITAWPKPPAPRPPSPPARLAHTLAEHNPGRGVETTTPTTTRRVVPADTEEV